MNYEITKPLSLSVSLCLCLSVCPSVSLSICLSVCLSVLYSVSLPQHCSSVHKSVAVCLSVCLSACLYLSPPPPLSLSLRDLTVQFSYSFIHSCIIHDRSGSPQMMPCILLVNMRIIGGMCKRKCKVLTLSVSGETQLSDKALSVSIRRVDCTCSSYN